MQLKDSKVVFYDFGRSNMHNDFNTLTKSRIRNDAPKDSPEKELSLESLNRLRNKLNQLREVYLSENGRIFALQIFDSLKDKRNWPTTDTTFETFYSEFERRIISSIEFVDALISEKEERKAA